MAKKKSGSTPKSTAKAAKKAKAAQKTERKEKKKVGKSKNEDDDEDLEGILDKMRREWEAAHTVTEELAEGPPSRRANATLTACPNGNHLWCIGGEFFSEDKKAYFYKDVFRYTPEKDEWRTFVSQTCPGPRSAHAVVASPAGGGKLFLFGGEFSSLHQNTFHHYGDFWCFDLTTHSWDRIDTKIRPSARSGHRMAIWKHYIVLFGGFYDPGITTRYLNDLWVFDTQEYKWRQIEFRDTDLKPSPRSGFSFLPTPDGIVLHGGYCKEYVKGKRPVGVMLSDTWFLKMSLSPTPSASAAKPKSADTSPLTLKWERRKRPAYAPSLRSGCTMALWASKNTGVLFGGVTDEDTGEETLESVFWNDLYGYQLDGKGRWISLTLKRPKPKGGAKKKKKPAVVVAPVYEPDDDEEGSDSGDDTDHGKAVAPKSPTNKLPVLAVVSQEPEIDPDDPILTVPLARYNAMLAVLRNTLYIYGGIYERGSREYTLDDFYALPLDKLDRYVCLKESGVVIADGEESSSEDDDDDDDDDDEDGDDDEDDGGDDDGGGEETVKPGGVQDKHDNDSDEEPAGDEPSPEVDEPVENEPSQDETDALRLQATAFMGVSKDTTRSAEDVVSTPLPGETLAMFYARSREHWKQKAFSTSDNRGKQLRRDGFGLAQERYAEYKPILQEVEKILAEAGLNEEEMRRGAAGGPAGSNTGESRNRR